MKRLLGLLLVMGIVGCGGGEAPDWVSKDGMWVQRGGLTYATKGDSETPFTGVVVLLKHENGKKQLEVTYKDGKKEGLSTMWHANGQKMMEGTYKDGKKEGLHTDWHENGQKRSEATYKGGKLVSETNWDKEGNELK